MKGVKNIDRYYEKAVVTGDIIEVYRYEKLNTKGGGKREGEGEQKESNYKSRQRQRRNMIRRLICQNFDNKSKFVTLTFGNTLLLGYDITDVKACNHAFKLFIQRLRGYYPDLKYVAVIEFQKRGAVHYHMVCNLPYIDKAVLAAVWGQGFIKVNAIDKVDNLGAYVIKYMTVDTEDNRLMGLKAYNASKGLKRPIEANSWGKDTDLLQGIENLLKSHSPSYATTYESEKAGKVEYFQYNLRRDYNSNQRAKSSFKAYDTASSQPSEADTIE